MRLRAGSLCLMLAALLAPDAMACDPAPFILKWGTPGSAPGLFSFPRGIASDGQGHIYVTDGANYRIQKFTRDGDFLLQWGTSGSGNGQFECVEGIAVDPTGLFVYAADNCAHRVQKFTSSGVYVSDLGPRGSDPGEFTFPSGVATDRHGNVYVADGGNDRIQMFAAGGSLIRMWGSFGSDTGEFRDPEAVAADDSGHVFVLDRGNHRIQKFTDDGQFLRSWGTQGAGIGQFSDPRGIACDDSGHVLVADTQNHRIQKFRGDSTYVTHWGAFGTGDGQFRRPWGVVSDQGSFVLVVELQGQRVQKFATCPSSSSDSPDSDCDGLSNAVEAQIHTDPLHPDTDRDGLMDSWEADPMVPGSGFDLDCDGTPEVARDEVFGPYVTQAPNRIDASLRPVGQYSLVGKPDPLHKDVFLELDWLDCKRQGCVQPGFPWFDIDPTHHAPNLDGLLDVIREFRSAPVSNPDNTDGVNLRILVDEGLRHIPNCDRDQSALRLPRFGTPVQRRSPGVMEARKRTFRYVTSGHSSKVDNGPGVCPSPTASEMLRSGMGLRPLPPYDWSPFGNARVGGRDIIVSLGPVWICPEENTALGYIPVCFRGVTLMPVPNPLPSYPPIIWTPNLGIFPATISDTMSLPTPLTLEAPIQQLLGVSAGRGARQLWGRTLMHLLGHSLGIASEATVGNVPDLPGLRMPESYSNWSNLQYAPGDGVPGPNESFPNYTALVGQDGDGDGIAESLDNCPGVANASQKDTDGDRVGDACDRDADNDGLLTAATSSAAATPSVSLSTVDPYPFDTDNDGIDNDVDGDDDGDGVPDAEDLCPLVADPGQEDFDGDGIGDACDEDSDDDGAPDRLELAAGSDPRRYESEPEIVGYYDYCSNNSDDDLDGLMDAADPGCQDSDGDGTPDFMDLCPGVADEPFSDFDGDSLGDECDPDDDNDGVADEQDLCPSTPAMASVDVDGCSISEVDFDGDGVCNPQAVSGGPQACTGSDNCPTVGNPGQADADLDGIGNPCDNCPSVFNPDQADSNANGSGDACENVADREPPAAPLRFALFQTYPNPASRAAAVRFDLPTRALVTLEVYSVLGQRVRTAAQDQLFEPGRHTTILELGLRPGVYFLRMSARAPDGRTATFRSARKMIVVR